MNRDLQIKIVKGMYRDVYKKTCYLDFDEMDDDELNQLQLELDEKIEQANSKPDVMSYHCGDNTPNQFMAFFSK